MVHRPGFVVDGDRVGLEHSDLYPNTPAVAHAGRTRPGDQVCYLDTQGPGTPTTNDCSRTIRCFGMPSKTRIPRIQKRRNHCQNIQENMQPGKQECSSKSQSFGIGYNTKETREKISNDGREERRIVNSKLANFVYMPDRSVVERSI